MHIENLKEIIHLVSKGDTSAAELLFDRPGGRKYFESIVLIVVNNLPYQEEEKIDLFTAFIHALNKIEKRIKRQKEGQRILRQVYF
jgi:ribosome-associated translation inhibitor RaiA